MNKKLYMETQLHELLYQGLKTELGGLKIYAAALSHAQDESLGYSWQNYLEQTRSQEQVLLKVFAELGLNPDRLTTRG
ncbi:hypothetical protein [Halopseudomonas salegens]|uniref:Uncharacterized protein n=1 Tax=Halopseudomonas salegens TaxID=1434072 RepID=A0A1H2GU75_9GAMM|nr:hypothetical protein [Halopseudomonas salegens]SDU22995.1 hypothetical protein SAMN05216210_2543 [Halopseudomonas salegens]